MRQRRFHARPETHRAEYPLLRAVFRLASEHRWIGKIDAAVHDADRFSRNARAQQFSLNCFADSNDTRDETRIFSAPLQAKHGAAMRDDAQSRHAGEHSRDFPRKNRVAVVKVQNLRAFASQQQRQSRRANEIELAAHAQPLSRVLTARRAFNQRRSGRRNNQRPVAFRQQPARQQMA